MLVKGIAAYRLYPSIFNRLRAIARYWSEIVTFLPQLHLTPQLGCSQWNSGKRCGPQKTRIMGLLGSGKKLGGTSSPFYPLHPFPSPSLPSPPLSTSFPPSSPLPSPLRPSPTFKSRPHIAAKEFGERLSSTFHS